MKYLNRKGAIAALLGALALLSGCGSSGQSNPYNSNNPYGFNGGGGFGGGVPAGGCFPANQPIPFTVSGAYLSGMIMNTLPGNYASGTASSGGSGASPGYFRDTSAEGSVAMDIIPATTDWAPFATNPSTGRPIYPTTGNARGTITLGALTVATYQSYGNGQAPCISVLGISTGFVGGQLSGTRIKIRVVSGTASFEDLLYF